MFIRDSRRSYRTYSYAELILITDLGAFRTPVGVTELMLRSLTYSEVPVGTTEITECVQVLRNLLLDGSTCKYYETYTDLTEHILVLRILYCNSDTEVHVGTIEYFTGTRVPVGTTEQIPYTEVLIGTIGLVRIY